MRTCFEAHPLGSGIWDKCFSDKADRDYHGFARRRVNTAVCRIAILLFCAFLLVIVALSYTPGFGELDLVATILLASLIFGVLSAGAALGLKSRLFSVLFPVSYCPDCACPIPLVDLWHCAGRCASLSRRHVLAGCATCGAVPVAMTCVNPGCQKQIYFSEICRDVAIANRNNAYVTVPNDWFRLALLGTCFGTFVAFMGYEQALSVVNGVGTAVLLACIGVLLLCKPRKLLANPYFIRREDGKCRLTIAASRSS